MLEDFNHTKIVYGKSLSSDNTNGLRKAMSEFNTELSERNITQEFIDLSSV